MSIFYLNIEIIIDNFNKLIDEKPSNFEDISAAAVVDESQKQAEAVIPSAVDESKESL